MFGAVEYGGGGGFEEGDGEFFGGAALVGLDGATHLGGVAGEGFSGFGVAGYANFVDGVAVVVGVDLAVFSIEVD